MSSELTNEEIRRRLLDLNYDCGPVTDTTRDVLLKKLLSLNNKLQEEGKGNTGITDEELRSQLMSYGVSVAPITATNRHVYLKRLQALKRSKKVPKKEVEMFPDGCEPMDVDPPDFLYQS